jgi:hypothetical protein
MTRPVQAAASDGWMMAVANSLARDEAHDGRAGD